MAFPSRHRKTADPAFLKPYVPDDFVSEQVHVERGPNVGFLYRIDPCSNGRVVILVQSALEPDWDYAFHNAGVLLAASPETKPFNPSFEVGQVLQFRLAANCTKTLVRRDAASGARRNGQRVPVPSDQHADWLIRRSERGGFTVDTGCLAMQSGFVNINMKGDDRGQRLFSVRYDGKMRVVDPESLRKAIFAGIGPAKAFGFGLLSVARSV
jgi:CRISPR system Cascade subunit CasE